MGTGRSPHRLFLFLEASNFPFEDLKLVNLSHYVCRTGAVDKN